MQTTKRVGTEAMNSRTSRLSTTGSDSSRDDTVIVRALREQPRPWWLKLSGPQYIALLVIAFAAFIGIWHLCTAVFQLINPVFLPGPGAVAIALAEMFVSGEVYPYLAYSAVEWVFGYGAAAIVGVFIGWAMGTFTPIAHLVGPYVWLLAAAPWIAFQPLYTVWFGFGQFGVIMLVFTASITTIVFNTAMGVQNADISMRRAASVFGATPLQRFWKVTLPSAGPFVLLGLRYALVSAMLAVLLAEIAGSTKGLGGLMTFKTALYQTPAAYGILVIPVVVTLILGGLMQLSARKLSGGTIK